MWFRKLSEIAIAGDQVAIVIFNDEPYLINISRNIISEELTIDKSPIRALLKAYVDADSTIADELLNKLKELAVKPFKALRTGDTAIGFTLETLLDIEANSSKLPDYKGIELKAGRGGKNRSNLFAQVAKWDISPCKKSAEILDNYGYQRDDDFKLYCTVSTQRSNSQGLHFKYDKSTDQLQEWHDNGELVAIWPGYILRDRLLEKHAETFWIEAESFFIEGIEHFQLKSVIHTKQPIASQLLPLIESGVITMDHLIKRNGKTNRVSEKGPLFKIDKKNLNLLFPEPTKYSLV
ncbi:MAG: MvaI/BcnI restriction endonuclease family protein [Flavobacteriales bacterium]|nr:MvaI/BcnI restriction endonuclease family protein [Flavobacteriales bacterium]